jgi:hypothetical protein
MPLSTEILAELVEKKHDLLVQLRDVGLRQMELIDGGDMTQLLKLLSSKQRLLTALQDIERQLNPFRRENPDDRVWRNPADRQRCAEVAARSEALLAEVVAQEKRSETQLRAHRDRVAEELEGAHQAARAASAYGDNPWTHSRQLDLSSEG